MRGKIIDYVSQKDKKELAVEIKKVLKKYGMKANIVKSIPIVFTNITRELLTNF